MVNIPKNKASAGRILIKPRGEWDANITYEMLDLVNHNGYAFLAKRTVVGIEPSNEHSSYWHNMLDIETIVENAIAGTVADEVGDILEARFRDMLSEARYVSDLASDLTEATFVKWDAETENTPYKEGLTGCTEGFALVYGICAENHTIIAWTKGGEKYDCYMRNVNNGVVKEWGVLSKLFDDKFLPFTGGTLTGSLGLGDGKGKLSADEGSTFIESVKDNENKRRIEVANPLDESVGIEDSVKFISAENGVRQEFNLFGEHNANAFNLAKITTGSYEGKGVYGSAHPNKITVPFKPLVCMVWSNGSGSYDGHVTMCYPMSSYYMVNNDNGAILSWEDKALSWYTTSTYGNDSQLCAAQHNQKGVTYNYIVIGC